MYQKEIIYMSMYKDDIKEGCVGYLKSGEREGKIKLELQVKNIPDTLTGEYPIRLKSAESWNETGTLVIKNGHGKWTGIATEPILKAEIILSGASMIKGQSKNASVSKEIDRKQQAVTKSGENENDLQVEKEVREKETIVKELGVQDTAEFDKVGENKPQMQVRAENDEQGLRTRAKEETVENGLRTQAKAEPVENGLRTQVKAEQFENELKAQAGTELRESGAEKWTMSENAPLYESKWEQLLATYEQIHPYGDNRVYVKLEPKDFVILPSGYQHLVNNSFLLHGFYNYRYLILGKEKDFYLGVPGVFYEREKMVALMFGFEAFECEGGNAKEGKFGYYLRKVEL